MSTWLEINDIKNMPLTYIQLPSDQPIAQEDIKELYDYFSRFSLQYVDSFVEGLYEQLEGLKSFPQMGKKYTENNKYRQLIYQNYRILYVYREEEDRIIIMIVVHCSRHLKL